MALTKKARELRNAYQRKLYRKNREKAIKRQEEYWNQKARAAEEAEKEAAND